MKTNENIALLADAYKYAHHKLYAPGTTRIYSYMESRGGAFDETVFFGLQYFLKHYLEGAVLTKEKVDEAAALMPQVFGRPDVFDRRLFDYMVDQHGGRLPVRIRAVPEGSHVPNHNVLLTIENTDPNCYWLTNFLETLLLQVWYPCTVASLSGAVRGVLEHYYDATASAEAAAGIDYVLNDFGFRGVSSVESAGIGGAAHLLHFQGSDTIAASLLLRRYYGAEGMPGKSVPATEHSVCTLLGEEGELDVFRQALHRYPAGILSVVSDSYDVFRACSDYWGGALREEVLARKGTLVIRPDSGDPVFTLLRVFELLFARFGFAVNEKGYKVLPPQVRVLQGDGINLDSIRAIYGALQVNGISAENLVLGMGGALLQKVDRDTQRFALKCSWAEVNGQAVEVQKRPVELDAQGRMTRSFKQSKGGRLKLVQDAQGYRTVREGEALLLPDELVTVFENGVLYNEQRYDDIRQRAHRAQQLQAEASM